MPLYHCASNLPPICLITGDRAIEFKCRVEENELLAASLRALGTPRRSSTRWVASTTAPSAKGPYRPQRVHQCRLVLPNRKP
jgi:hypothetical protein